MGGASWALMWASLQSSDPGRGCMGGGPGILPVLGGKDHLVDEPQHHGGFLHTDQAPAGAQMPFCL